ncbi:MAG: serpin family protein [Candidatus Zixiibacteriota bacterium]|nr:MAG: serpin family protein [candidate division Zixibacteria bacterium]
MRAKRSIRAIAFIMIFAFFADSGHAEDGNLGASINSFGLKLFEEVIKEKEGKNVMISPLSVSMALSMVYNGAEGETREAMAGTLELNGTSIDKINESYRNLSQTLMTLDSAVVFQIANSIWYRQNLHVEDDFLDMNRSFFNAEISPCNFGDPGTADTINAWVYRNTNGKIPDIVEKPINPDLLMILINAIYFHGDWTRKFDVEDTKDDEFTLTDGSRVTCKMMNQENRFRYLENDSFQAVELPYGNRAFSMIIFLPKPDAGIDDLIGRLDDASLKLWTGNLRSRKGTISMPRFKLEYNKTLTDMLSSLGMGMAFSGAADFSGISAQDQMFISFVKHKTYVDVDEEGTEAAAVTSVGMATSAGPSEKFVMRVDRPFLFLIRESGSGTIMFLGKIADPTSG